MSVCAIADQAARWVVSEPPRWPIRRTTAIVAASLLLLVLAGVPAWAGSSFVEPEVEADMDQPLTLTVTEPEDEPDDEAYGDTARVVVTAPDGFTVIRCDSTPVEWSCTVAEDETRLTLTRTSPLALGTTYDFGFTVHTPVVNGTYKFAVTQADGPPSEEDPPATRSSQPAVTVTGGQTPKPKPSPTPPADDGGSQTDDGGTTSGSGSQADDPTGEDGGAGTDAGSGDSSTDTTSGGSTAPRRTQGRASGTTLEIIPGEPIGGEPGVAPPDVADDPAITPPGDTDPTADDDSTAVAASGAQASDEPPGAPWQQWVGAAMLLAGLATVGVRWLRQRRSP